MIPTKTPAPTPAVVLDTNAALDWLVFVDPGMANLACAIMAGTVRWIASPRMREELARTLAYPVLASWSPDCVHTLTSFDRWAVVQAEPVSQHLKPLVCTDPDDQVFIDLAIEHGARWLVSHDRALLKLERHAAARGLLILPPARWPG